VDGTIVTDDVEETPQELELQVDVAAATIVTGPTGGAGGAVYTALFPLGVW
jgi:hypothetical protein